MSASLKHAVVAVALLAVLGCSGSKQTEESAPAVDTSLIGEAELIESLEAAGLKVERSAGQPRLHFYQTDQLPKDHGVMFTLRITGKSERPETMTFIQVTTPQATVMGGVAGFAVRNWIVFGTVSKALQQEIKDAVDAGREG